MKSYYVVIPITGILSIDVDAESEEAATLDDLEERETHRIIVQGNIFHGVQNEIEARDVSEWTN